MFYGFIIIFIAWVWYWGKFNRGHKSFDPWFLRILAIGQLLVVLDTFHYANWHTWAGLGTLLILLVLVWKSS